MAADSLLFNGTTTLSERRFADIAARYATDGEGRVGLALVPAARAGDVVPPRRLRRGVEYDNLPIIPENGLPGSRIDPIVHLHRRGDEQPGGFSGGLSMRRSESTLRLRLVRQEHDGPAVRTLLDDGLGGRVAHRLTPVGDGRVLRVETAFHNAGPDAVTLDFLTSFSLGGVTPFAGDDAPGRLVLHRFRSFWSAEGFADAAPLEDLHLVRSWAGHSANVLRFGQVGTMPVRGFHPWVAIEDTAAGVTWAATLAWPGSWQMEIDRRDDRVALSGGLADRELGHWSMTVQPGGTLAAPAAFVTVVEGGVEEACDRLLIAQDQAAPLEEMPRAEHDLPVVYNEWCTTWGDPSQERVEALADRLEGSGVRYLVIDAGWYKDEARGGGWSNSQGDWRPNPRQFPDGIKAAADAIRDRGLIPGLWFEWEVAGQFGEAFTRHERHLLHRDGRALTSGGRRFWNLSDPWAVDYLRRRMVDLLRDAGIGYLKVDYNDTLGIGVDDPDGLGAGLYRQTLAMQRFWDELRETLPELVIENCSSGGHRLEPSMMGRCAMGSFSDAHETAEIPLVAANLHRLILPRQSQVWGVLHPSDSPDRIDYTLAACFLGRMCLSGDVERLDDHQWSRVREAIRLYRVAAAPVLADCVSRRFGALPTNHRHPAGWQAVRLVGNDAALVVTHRFADGPEHADVPLPRGGWKVTRQFGGRAEVIDRGLRVALPRPFTSAVSVLQADAR